MFTATSLFLLFFWKQERCEICYMGIYIVNLTSFPAPASTSPLANQGGSNLRASSNVTP